MRSGRSSVLAFCLLAACGGPQPLLPAPPAGHGIQVNVGPFEVPRPTGSPAPGSVDGEVQICRTLKLPNTEPMAVTEIQAKMNIGSHHMIIFRSDLDFPDQYFPCWGTVNFDDWAFVLDVNRPEPVDWKLAAGQALVMKPHQQIMIQTHYLNATTVQAPLGGFVTINFMSSPMATVAHQLRGLFTVNTALAFHPLPPHAAYTTPARLCTFSRSVAIVAMTGHFHKRGTLFDVHQTKEPTRGATSVTDMGQIYQSTDWNAPPFQLFDPPLEIDTSRLTSGGLGFQCSYYNDNDFPIGWGGHADVQEHCNLFFQYYDIVDPSPDAPMLACNQGSGGW